MKKLSKTFSTIIIVLVILGLTLPVLSIFAQENLQAPLREVSNKVEELIELKDDNTLSDQEKEEKEIQVRKEALEKIIDLSLIETKNLANKINALELSSEDQIAIKVKLISILDANESYSKELKTKTEKEDISLEEIKNLAQEYKDWRDENYNKYVKKITVFILTFQEKQVLKTADIRLEKIMSDLKKLEDLKVLKKEDTLKFITDSTKNLANAQVLNKNAESLIIEIIKKDLLETATTSPETLSASTTPEIASISLMAAPAPSQEQEIATTTAKIITEEENAQSLIEQSLQEIKNAYTNFISISTKVNQRLKLR